MIAIATVALYLFHERAVLCRRNAQSWESLVSRFDLEWTTPGMSNHPSQQINASEDAGAHTERVRNLRAIYREAGVMLELADYAERNGDSSDTATVKALRIDAVQIRIGVVKTLVMRSYPRWTP
jgi:hypothetical protein